MKSLPVLFAHLGRVIGEILDHPDTPYTIAQELMDLTANLSAHRPVSSYCREALIAKQVFPEDLVHILEAEDERKAVNRVIDNLETEA